MLTNSPMNIKKELNLVSEFPRSKSYQASESQSDPCRPHIATHRTQRIRRQQAGARHHSSPPEVVFSCLNGSVPGSIRDGGIGYCPAWEGHCHLGEMCQERVQLVLVGCACQVAST